MFKLLLLIIVIIVIGMVISADPFTSNPINDLYQIAKSLS